MTYAIRTEYLSRAGQTSPLMTYSLSLVPCQMPTRTGVYTNGRFVELSPELYADLLSDSIARQITLEQAYQEELEAQQRLDAITPPLDKVLEIARRGGAPSYMKNP